MNEHSSETQSFLSDPDVLLMLEVRAGNQAAFENLMRKYYKRVLNFIYRVVLNAAEAEDLTQEVFIRIFKAAPRYRPEAKFQTWLYTVAKNTSLNSLRSKKLRTYSLDQRVEGEDGSSPRQFADRSAGNAAQELQQRELADAVRQAIQGLPENQRLAVVLRRYEDLSYEDIATTLGATVPAVKSLLSRAKESLKLRLQAVIRRD